MKSFAMLAALLLLTCSAFAQGSGPNTTTYPFSHVFYNDCCGEYVYVSGTVEATMTGKVGEEIPTMRVKMSGASGYTESGASGIYSQRGAMTMQLRTFQDGGFVSTGRISMVNDNGCSFTIKLTLKWYWELGQLVSEVLSSEVVCH